VPGTDGGCAPIHGPAQADPVGPVAVCPSLQILIVRRLSRGLACAGHVPVGSVTYSDSRSFTERPEGALDPCNRRSPAAAATFTSGVVLSRDHHVFTAQPLVLPGGGGGKPAVPCCGMVAP
jgi:hypothetical protein